MEFDVSAAHLSLGIGLLFTFSFLFQEKRKVQGEMKVD
jgi:hypothetical protein